MTLQVTVTHGKEQQSCTSGNFHAQTMEFGNQVLTIGPDSIHFDPPLRRKPLVDGVNSEYSNGRLRLIGVGQFSIKEGDLVIFGTHTIKPLKQPDNSLVG